ncbi:MAG: hypothetical protein DI626_05525 [Micavibrio aeruginosavorus]|uniref:Type IV secretion protein DotA n=1 Tax=Micavibrio aeruginosavorus TaxID=349221 RepID=A0A2W5A0D1_9BACT|nr:MAG: hypothetical protein DI626_05525 [Micavibrio aeruginosavorus]
MGRPTKKQVAAYMLLPQVMPRINRLYSDGFGQLSYLIALVYRAVNLLSEDHPAFIAARQGKAGIREVIAAAGAELKYTRQNIDQVIIYFAILLGMVLLVCQFFLMLGFIFMNPAFAATPSNYGEFFLDPSKDDVAYRLLYSVFGVPELFKAGGGGTRSQFHAALHGLFQFYSIGMLVVAVIIICYHIFSILAETAQTGVPFGKRYSNNPWAPIRLVVALGLLIPIGYGLNAAQWITLYAAKFGSDFATKGWVLFNDKMNEAYLNKPEERVGTPQTPELTEIAAFMMLQTGCEVAYQEMYKGDNAKQMDGWLVKSATEGEALPLSSTDFDKALEFFHKGDILIRFGEKHQRHGDKLGSVMPYCGEILILAGDKYEPGSKDIQKYYYDLIKNMHLGEYGLWMHANNFIKKYITLRNVQNPGADLPPPTFKAETSKKLQEETEKAIAKAVKLQRDSKTWDKDNKLVREYGWGGAGIWYNKIAQINGSMVTAVGNIPQIRSMPLVMEQVRREKLQQNQDVSDPFSSIFLSDGREIQLSPDDRTIGGALVYIYQYWRDDNINQTSIGSQTGITGNFLIDAINLVFGTRGLFNMCANADVHPLAQLSILGKGMMEASIRNLGLAYGFMFGQIMNNAIGSAMGAASGILMSVATVTITMGFMLFYVIPFMPFLYFFFAVAGWVKGLFEAMVGMPLWALAHLRIDGEGLHGDAGIRGVYFIFEIFLRPILIIFGLLASVVIFAALVKVLNEIYSIVVTNLSGHDQTFKELCGKNLQGSGAAGNGNSGSTSPMNYFRGPIDELFFTIIYAIIVYMIGMSCFKLIDLIPNNLMRYMGTDVQTFNDRAGDPTQNMMRNLSISTSEVSKSVFGQSGAISQGIGSVTSGVSGIAAQLSKQEKTGP